MGDAQADIIDRLSCPRSGAGHAQAPALRSMAEHDAAGGRRHPARPWDRRERVHGWAGLLDRSNRRSSQQGCGTFLKGGAQGPGALGEAGFVEVGVIHRSRSLLVVGGHKRLLRHVRQFAIGS